MAQLEFYRRITPCQTAAVLFISSPNLRSDALGQRSSSKRNLNSFPIIFSRRALTEQSSYDRLKYIHDLPVATAKHERLMHSRTWDSGQKLL
jgi:hypothetical protein